MTAPSPPLSDAELDALISAALIFAPTRGREILLCFLDKLAAAIAQLRQERDEIKVEREDWARRFKLNGITPWEWMTRAEAAEGLLRKAHELRQERDYWREQTDLYEKTCQNMDGNLFHMLADNAALRARADAAVKAIREHNDELQATCDWKRNRGHCDGFVIRGRQCVDCPRHFAIDAALAQEDKE